MLSPEEQKYATLFIRDIQSGDIEVDPEKTFRDYISEYMRREEDLRIARMVRRLGCYAEKLRELLNRHVTAENINEGNRFNELVESVDRDRARKFFQAVEKQKYKEYRLEMLIHNYLRNFILSGGIDPYADVVDSRSADSAEKDSSEATQKKKSETNSSDEHSTCEESRYHVSSSVKGKRFNKWYSGSGRDNALARMMDTGCFAYLEEKVCLNQAEYVQRGDDGKMHLTAYAKAHEEECFLQFVEDDAGNLHYVRLPSKLANKEFKYSEYISDDILRKYGLINEIASEMLQAIERLDFGPAMVELMSKRICNYSVGLLRSITGLDNRTIANMRKGENLTKLNVVSVCLGIHIPYPVSEAMTKLAGLAFPLDRGPVDNMTYITLLSTRWASDYDDIVDDLNEQGLGHLIKHNKNL